MDDLIGFCLLISLHLIRFSPTESEMRSLQDRGRSAHFYFRLSFPGLVDHLHSGGSGAALEQLPSVQVSQLQLYNYNYNCKLRLNNRSAAS